MSQLLSHNNINSHNTTFINSTFINPNYINPTYTNTTYTNSTIVDDRASILAWLSPLDPKLRHQDVRDRRIENVGEWVLEADEFSSWYTGTKGDGSEKAVLFCYGDPGVGKTFIR